MNQAEFKVTTDLAPLGEFRIDANFDECEKWLTENLATYRSMVVTEDNLQEVKKVIAKIRKTRDSIDLYRKEVKKACLAICTPFEERAKRLTAMCDEDANGLNAKVKVFDEEKKQKKIAELRDYFDSLATDVSQFIAFDALYNPRWENVTYAIDEAKEEIASAVRSATIEVKAIKAIKSPFESILLEFYKEKRSLDWIFEENEKLEAQAQKAAEEQKALAFGINNEPQTFIVGHRTETQPFQDAGVSCQAAAESCRIATEDMQPVKESLQTVAFRVTGTVKQLEELKAALKEIGLKPERV